MRTDASPRPRTVPAAGWAVVGKLAVAVLSTLTCTVAGSTAPPEGPGAADLCRAGVLRPGTSATAMGLRAEARWSRSERLP